MHAVSELEPFLEFNRETERFQPSSLCQIVKTIYTKPEDQKLAFVVFSAFDSGILASYHGMNEAKKVPFFVISLKIIRSLGDLPWMIVICMLSLERLMLF